MTGFSDSTANIVVVSKDFGSGLSAGSYESYFELAVQAIRSGTIDGEDVKELQKLLKEQHLNKFVKINLSLNEDSLIQEDDARNSKRETDY
ncbi:MAG: hypothetical protein DRJ07_20895 [Bacteroidetes bacterium]|nr:MAG: hypothetical protein DRJ07_20895 [Bacteroidota bacterium]